LPKSASPCSKDGPPILSESMNTLTTLPKKFFRSYIAQVTPVLSPTGRNVKSTVLVPSIGRFHSMRIRTSSPGLLRSSPSLRQCRCYHPNCTSRRRPRRVRRKRSSRWDPILGMDSRHRTCGGRSPAHSALLAKREEWRSARRGILRGDWRHRPGTSRRSRGGIF
jgi:hypothetical protein